MPVSILFTWHPLAGVPQAVSPVIGAVSGEVNDVACVLVARKNQLSQTSLFLSKYLYLYLYLYITYLDLSSYIRMT